MILQRGQWRQAVSSYLASMYFVDTMIGRVLEALRNGPHADRTMVVLWSDHGFHLGQKDHWHKYLLWEQTTHVPFIISAPGVTRAGSRCEQPVTLLHVYKTLADLCGIEARPGVEGLSLRPLIEHPEASWDEPAISSLDSGSHAIRTDRWRYIRYSDMTEELYDHDADPHEWHNLADRPEFEEIKRKLGERLPRPEAAASS